MPIAVWAVFGLAGLELRLDIVCRYSDRIGAERNSIWDLWIYGFTFMDDEW